MTKRERKYLKRPKVTKVMVNKKEIMQLFKEYLQAGKGMRPTMYWYADNLKDRIHKSESNNS